MSWPKQRELNELETEIIVACIKNHHADGETPDIALANKYSPDIILKTMDAMSDEGILGYGVSLRTAWVETEWVEKHWKHHWAIWAALIKQKDGWD